MPMGANWLVVLRMYHALSGKATWRWAIANALAFAANEGKRHGIKGSGH